MPQPNEPEPAPEPLWRPGPAAEASGLAAYRRWLAAERGVDLPGYRELHRWSVADPGRFWETVWDHFAVDASRPYERPLGRRGMPGAEWFPGAELSFAAHVFRDRDDAGTAIVHASELRPQQETTWGELRALAAAVAAGLTRLGVGRGDRVAAYLPNVPEAVAAFLGCASIGAVWSSCSPDFGARSVADRFAQIEPKVLLAVDGYRYGGRDFDRREVVAGLAAAIPSLEHTVLVPHLDPGARLEGTLPWDGFLVPAQLEPAELPFDHPLWILYSSGTTGLPKAIVHGQGGILLEHLKQLHFHVDARPGDRLFWFTTTGWMMWNLLVGGLLTGSAIVLYDGSPAGEALWDLAATAGITCFGTSAAFIHACLKEDLHPARGRDLSRLRAVGSTGSPLSPDGFRWVYGELGDVWLFSMSGGTDVCTAFLGGVPTLPVYPGELQGPALGAAVAAFDEAGRPVVGQVGELVLTEPLPSMPLYLWNDPDGSRYRESYFSTYPGVWRHGDWVELTPRGTAIISGRSDATINRGGVRIGTAELYGAVLRVPEVADALAIDLPQAGGESRLLLFVVLAAGATLDDALRAAVIRRIREDCSPRHAPDEIRAVPEIPRTLSGKIVEVPVKRILMGEPVERVVSPGTLANPQALDAFRAQDS
jgi:acetoacetyl-CoA synthetase